MCVCRLHVSVDTVHGADLPVLAADGWQLVDRHDVLCGGQETARARVRPDSHLGDGGGARARRARCTRVLRVEVQQ